MPFFASATFWSVIGLVAIVLVWVLSSVLAPFVAGMAIAYLLDPLVDRLERLRLPRLAATGLVTVAFFAVVVIGLAFVVPLAVGEVAAFLERLPGYLERLHAFFAALAGRIGGGSAFFATLGEKDVNALGNLLPPDMALQWAGGVASVLWAGGQTVAGIVSLLIVTPVVAFYLLLDWDRLVAHIDGVLPRAHLMTIRALAREMDDSIAGFVRGQFMVCLLLGLLYSVLLWFVGLEFAFVVGFAAGLLSFIPFFGAIIGGLIAGGLAVAQFWPDFIPIVLVVGIFVIGQLVEGNVLTPRIVGRKIRLHPVWLLFALLAFGSVFGVTGLLLATPAAASIGVLVRFCLGLYARSGFYAHTQAAPAPADEDADTPADEDSGAPTPAKKDPAP